MHMRADSHRESLFRDVPSGGHLVDCYHHNLAIVSRMLYDTMGERLSWRPCMHDEGEREIHYFESVVRGERVQYSQ